MVLHYQRPSSSVLRPPISSEPPSSNTNPNQIPLAITCPSSNNPLAEEVFNERIRKSKIVPEEAHFEHPDQTSPAIVQCS